MAKKKSSPQKQVTEFESGIKNDNSLSSVLEEASQISRLSDQLSQLGTLEKTIRGDLISNRRNLLASLYAENGLVRTFIDIPIDDAFNGGLEIESSQLDAAQLKNLGDEMEEKDDISQIKDAGRWMRLFGGGGLLFITNENYETPLTVKNIKELELRACDLWELYNIGADSGLDYENGWRDFDVAQFTYYSKKVDRSRVFPLKGRTAPALYRLRTRGWGLSEVESLVRSLNQYMKANNLSFEVLDEFKIDVFRLDQLAQTMNAPGGHEKAVKRVALANSRKRYDSALVMDKNDEYEQKMLNFSGIAETMREIKSHIASDLRMPMTKLFGISSAGFNSGEDDIENYNSMIESQIRPKLKPMIQKSLKLRCQAMYGFVPDDLTFKYKSLRIMSSVDEESVKTSKFNRLLQARQAGEISKEEFIEGCNKDSLLPVQVKNTSALLDGGFDVTE